MSEQLPEDYVSGLAKPSVFNKTFISIFKVFFLFLRIAVGAFFIYLFFGIGGVKGVYVNFFSITVAASVVGTLIPMIIRAAFLLVNTGNDFSLNLTLLFPSMSPLTWKYAILSQFELFYLWFVVLIALGVSYYSKMNKIKTLFISVLFFLFRSAIAVLLYMLVIKMKNSVQM